eukprot:4274103-Pyramimonas_sp.AAC.1
MVVSSRSGQRQERREAGEGEAGRGAHRQEDVLLRGEEVRGEALDLLGEGGREEHCLAFADARHVLPVHNLADLGGESKNQRVCHKGHDRNQKPKTYVRSMFGAGGGKSPRGGCECAVFTCGSKPMSSMWSEARESVREVVYCPGEGVKACLPAAQSPCRACGPPRRARGSARG